MIEAPINDLTAPEPLDVVWTAQNYHDLHDSFAKPADLSVINKKVFDALKPGGLYIVLDHSAEKRVPACAIPKRCTASIRPR